MEIFEEIIHHKFESKKRRALVNLIFTANVIQGCVAEQLRPLDLTFQQLNILSIVNGQKEGKANVNVIKERMFDRMSNVSRLLNKLVEKGWIIKDRCTNDQRVVYVEITKAGNEIRVKGRKSLEEIMTKKEVLNDVDSDLLNEFLEKMRNT